MAKFHHGITGQEVSQGILPMRNANVSVIGMVAVAADADPDMYPLNTPVLLTGITQDHFDKAGTDGTLLNCLRTIRDIHNPTAVVLRVEEVFDPELLNVFLECPTRFGLMPKRWGAPEIDTPDVARKLLSFATDRRGMVYASPRKADGTLITDKTEIVAYRDTFGAREICIIDGEWGVPGKSEPSTEVGGDTDCTPTFLEFYIPDMQVTNPKARYRINNGAWVDYTYGSSGSLKSQFVELLESIADQERDISIFGAMGDITDSSMSYYGKSPFLVEFYYGLIRGAYATEPLQEQQEDIIDLFKTTVEFEVTDASDSDLIHLVFGRNTSLQSCALANWYPLPR